MLAPVALALALVADGSGSALDKLTAGLSAEADARGARVQRASFTATTTSLDLDDAGRAQHSAVKVEHVVAGKSTTVSCTIDKVAVVDATEMAACSLPGMSIEVDSGAGGEPFASKERGNWRFDVVDAMHIRLTQVGNHDPAMVGMATVDASGSISTIDLAPARLPAFVDVMALRMRYADGAMGRMLETVSFELHAGALFFKKAIRTTTHYSEYAPTP